MQWTRHRSSKGLFPGWDQMPFISKLPRGLRGHRELESLPPTPASKILHTLYPLDSPWSKEMLRSCKSLHHLRELYIPGIGIGSREVFYLTYIYFQALWIRTTSLEPKNNHRVSISGVKRGAWKSFISCLAFIERWNAIRVHKGKHSI